MGDAEVGALTSAEEGGHFEEARPRFGRGGGAFAAPGDSRGVITMNMHRVPRMGIPEAQNCLVGNRAGKLQVRIGQGA